MLLIWRSRTYFGLTRTRRCYCCNLDAMPPATRPRTATGVGRRAPFPQHASILPQRTVHLPPLAFWCRSCIPNTDTTQHSSPFLPSSAVGVGCAFAPSGIFMLDLARSYDLRTALPNGCQPTTNARLPYITVNAHHRRTHTPSAR